MNTRNLIIFVLTIFMFFSCKSETEKPKAEYNQKANELIAQLISEGDCDCILEIPEESMIEFDTIEIPNFEYVNYYMKRLSLKNKKELDSVNNLSKKFVLDTKILERNDIKIIKRDSLRFLKYDINFNTKICQNLRYLIKPIFNKEFDIAIIDYGYSGFCLSQEKQIFEYKNKKWIRK